MHTFPTHVCYSVLPTAISVAHVQSEETVTFPTLLHFVKWQLLMQLSLLQIMLGPAPAITEMCRCSWVVMTCVTNLLIKPLNRPVREANVCVISQLRRQMLHIECCEFVFIKCFFTWYLLRCVRQLNSVINPKTYTFLSCCQISLFGVKLFLLVSLNVSCVFSLRWIFYWFQPSKNCLLFAAEV